MLSCHFILGLRRVFLTKILYALLEIYKIVDSHNPKTDIVISVEEK